MEEAGTLWEELQDDGSLRRLQQPDHLLVGQPVGARAPHAHDAVALLDQARRVGGATMRDARNNHACLPRQPPADAPGDLQPQRATRVPVQLNGAGPHGICNQTNVRYTTNAAVNFNGLRSCFYIA